ncbi:ubiquitin carboxyl-terminal hydrolase 50 isoform X2 [Microtus pennsylvanicus]|uniref:ubiquitin carboxyl-terminal hydrolase 50 isoform X2 n=1 Tax=Microtus pennsylvanicus TaxID=10058 RepID=UPI003F6D78F4
MEGLCQPRHCRSLGNPSRVSRGGGQQAELSVAWSRSPTTGFALHESAGTSCLSPSLLPRDCSEVTTAFAYLMTDMWLGDSDCVSPEIFLSALGSLYPVFLKKTQQDAQEFLIYVFNELHEALKKDCLQCFFQQDTLTWNNQIHCSFCESKQETAVRATISKAPKIIVFHLKRFDIQGTVKRKLRTEILYPLTNLDLTPYICPIFRKHPKYNLCAVVNHFGDLDGGHYTAFCKNSVTQAWYSFDDTRVSEIPDTSVQTATAYLLFYSCQPFSMPIQKRRS